MKKLVWISDFSFVGSGYATLSVPLVRGLGELGYDVKCIALEYRGEQHNLPASLIPARDFREVDTILQNLVNEWKPDVVIQAMDIPIQLRALKTYQERPFKFVGIFPVESDPMMITWAMELMQLDKRFVISEFGTEECRKVGLDAEHIQLGIDTDAWRLPVGDERKNIRTGYGLSDDTFVVLSVKDNQERKNIVRAMEIFADFHKDRPKSKYFLVTREHLSVGWNLRDYAQVLGINQNLQIFERGLPFAHLWGLYVAADCFLLTSKCEGLGLPLLESMAVGTHCIGTNCTAIAELLGEGRGYLIDPLDDFDLRYLDPFGSSNRYFARRTHGLELLTQCYNERPDTSKALEYVKSRTWDIPVNQLHEYLKSI